MIYVLVPFGKKEAGVVQNLVSSLCRRNHPSAYGSRVGTTGVRPGTEDTQVSSFQVLFIAHCLQKAKHAQDTIQ